MPLDPVTGSLIVAGIAGAGQGANAIAQGRMNRKTRNWNVRMHERMRAESLADFQMQNAYNHPSSQMARLREAGLNPNLVYGEGAVANNASPIKAAPVESWNPKAISVDAGGVAAQGISMYYDTQVKQATIDNLRQQNTVLEKDSELKAAQTIATLMSTRNVEQEVFTKEFNLALEKSLRDFTAQGRQLDVTKKEAEISAALAGTKMTLDENQRRQVMQAPTLTKAWEEIKSIVLGRAKTKAEIDQIREHIETQNLDQIIKDLEIKFQQKGFRSGDKLFPRMMYEALKNSSFGGIVEEYLKKHGLTLPEK